MAHTFDIRFDRSMGLAALLEAPTNSFRWKGSGRLSIDPTGISLACRPGWRSLLARKYTRRIPTGNLKQISREGDALRVEFASAGSERASLVFWARDRDTAAHIASLLPSSRTIELEHSTGRRDRKYPHALRSWVISGIAAAVVVLAALLAWTAMRTSPTASIPPTAPPLYQLPPLVVPTLPDAGSEPLTADSPLELDGAEPFLVQVPMPPLRMPELPQDQVVPIRAGSVANRIARRQLRVFETEAAGLWADYRTERDRLASRSLEPLIFADHLGELEMSWWNVTFRILDSRELDAPELLDLRADLLGVARHWRGFLDGYAEGVRTGDHVKIAESFDQLAIAEELQSRARRYVN